MKRFKKIMAVFCAGALTAAGGGCDITVKAAKKPVSLSETKLTLKAGKSKTLKVKKSGTVKIQKKTFKSDNKKVATVTKKGKIAAKKAGRATIKVAVKYKKGKGLKTSTLKCKVTVTEKELEKVSQPNQIPAANPPVPTGNGGTASNPSAPTDAGGTVATNNAGLYDEAGNLVKSWEELIKLDDEDESEISVDSDGCLDGSSRDISGTLVIGNNVKSIGDNAFSRCIDLTGVIIPDGVTSIGTAAFDTCISLTSVTIPDSVKSIGDSAFSGCSSLTGITIPDGVTSIADAAFFEIPQVIYDGGLTGYLSWGAVSVLRSDGTMLFPNATDWTSLQELRKEQEARGGDMPSMYSRFYRWNEEGRLIDIVCDGCELSGEISFSQFPYLQSIMCNANSLTALDVSGCKELTYLECEGNCLTSEGLNISGCAKLDTFLCFNNNLTNLDVSAFKELKNLECDRNALTSLDVSQNTKLEYLYCDYEVEITGYDTGRLARLMREEDCVLIREKDGTERWVDLSDFIQKWP